MDRKYGLGKTKNICGQKGGTYEFPPDRPDSKFSNIDDLKFILSFYSPHNNNKIIIKSYTGDEDEHQLKPENYEITGSLSGDSSKIIMKILYGARTCRWDLQQSCNTLARDVSKWNKNDDIKLNTLI